MSAPRTLAFLALIGISSSQTSDCSYLSLLNNLTLAPTNELLTIMRPVRNWTNPSLVQLDMVMYGILDVDEKAQTVTSHIWTQMFWRNEFLTWNPSDFCGINVLVIPRSMLWIPDITILEDTSDTGSVQDSPLVSLYPNGLVSTSKHQVLTSTCHLNLFQFPFDTQQCNITFVSFNYEADTVKLGTGSTSTNLTSLSEQLMVTQGEWQLKNIEIFNYTFIKDNISRSKLAYMVSIKRKPMLYVAIFIVPLFYLLVLDLASFCINESSGEKLSFKVTILLSISVLLLILKDMLPSTEEKLPLIATYCTVIFALVGVSVLEAMVVSFLIGLDGYSGKEAQSSGNTHMDIQLEATYHKEPATYEEQGIAKPEKRHLAMDWPSGLNLLRQILEEVKAARQEAGRQGKGELKPGRYKRLAQIIDYVFFALYFLTVASFSVCMYIVWIQGYFRNSGN
ncbi:5-hydroxytryptamine receptor 3A-like isoform X2 [Anabas testudineus]|uniref:5-hydroxytryptamine receptor 3A-like isoform X2 n=1 Tax=Anabas testudineus TaxID=64144 RepID=UPI000E45A236|nr:5-hydroxytryptamine receptor 3A-like isoform X2 [Anabas testudineus]